MPSTQRRAMPSQAPANPMDDASDAREEATRLASTPKSDSEGACLDLPGIARVAGMLADPSRAAMCAALLDGRAWTIGELAKHSRVAPSTASEHVAKLAEAALVERVKRGRRVYVRIADSRIATLLEGLAAHAAMLRDRQVPQ